MCKCDKCGEKFVEKCYSVVVKDNVPNGTIVGIVTIPNIPITESNLKLFYLTDKTFTKEFPKKTFFIQKYQVKQYNSTSIFTSTNYQIYEEDTDSIITFVRNDINDTFIPTRKDGKYNCAVTGASGKFVGATKVIQTIYTDTKDTTKYTQYTTFKISGYRPKCGKHDSDKK
jgi:hypothetical protein